MFFFLNMLFFFHKKKQSYACENRFFRKMPEFERFRQKKRFSALILRKNVQRSIFDHFFLKTSSKPPQPLRGERVPRSAAAARGKVAGTSENPKKSKKNWNKIKSWI